MLNEDEIRIRSQDLATRIVRDHFAESADLVAHFGESAEVKCRADTLHTLAFLADAVALDSPPLFADYVLWLRELLGDRRIDGTHVERDLRVMERVLREELSPAPGERVARCIHAAHEALAAGAGRTPASPPLPPLGERYLSLLLEGKRPEANQLVRDAADGGLSIETLYLDVFQPVLHEVGRRWQRGEIGVGHEHYVTAATHVAMSQFYPRVFGAERIGRTMVVACVDDERHELGARMIADLFEGRGWDTHYLGGDVPAADLVTAVLERRANVLALSVTLGANVSRAKEVIGELRPRPGGRAVRVLVGGHPFVAVESLWRVVGADAFAADAREALSRVTEQWGKGR